MANADEKRAWLRPELVAPWWEIAAVLAFMLAAPMAASSRDAILILHGEYFYHFRTALSYLRSISVQSAMLGAMLVYLHRRGWKAADLGIRASRRGVAQALILAALLLAASRVAAVTLHDVLNGLHLRRVPFAPISSVHRPYQVIGSHFWQGVILVVAQVINAAKEEMVYLGYGFRQIAARRGAGAALTVTFLLRMSCHTYHGIYVLNNAVTFLILSFWYWRTRNLWVVMAAHALFDLAL